MIRNETIQIRNYKYILKSALNYKSYGILFRRLFKVLFKTLYLLRFGNVKRYSIENIKLVSIQNYEQYFNVDQRSKIIEDATRIVNGEYCLFGKTIKLDSIFPDWHKDYLINDVNNNFDLALKSGHDVRAIWELNRLQFLPIIGLAFVFTGDDKYYLFFKEIIKDWNKKNPYESGVNWANAMECSLRLFSISFSTQFFYKKVSQDLEFSFLLKSLSVNLTLFIFNNLEITISGLKSNHFLSDLLGLYIFGLSFKSSKLGKKALKYTLNQYEKEIHNQIHQDGVNFEHSIPYHRFALELFLYPYLIGTKNNINFSDRFLASFKKMLQFTDDYLRLDNSAPCIGDNDNGRVLIITDYFSSKTDNHSYLVDFAKILFGKEQYSTASDKIYSEISIFYTIDKYLKSKTNEISELFRYYDDAKVVFYKNNDIYFNALFWDVGTKGIGNHQHNDMFSFEFGVNNEMFIIDPGNFNYTAYPEKRNLFRSTRYHNTVSVDGNELNNYSEFLLFRMDQTSFPHIQLCSFNNDILICEAEMLYTDNKSNVSPSRKFILNSKRHELTIIDSIKNAGEHFCEIFLHFNEQVSIYQKGNTFQLVGKASNLYLDFIGEKLEFQIYEGWISKSYYSISSSKYLRVYQEFNNKTEIKYKIRL